MKEKLAVQKVLGIKLTPEHLLKEAKLKIKKGDLIGHTGFFKRTNIYAKNNIWYISRWLDNIVIENPESSYYLEKEDKLYYKAYVSINIEGRKEPEIKHFNNNKEAEEFYNKIVKQFNLNPIY